jgi:hypothetical protein
VKSLSLRLGLAAVVVLLALLIMSQSLPIARGTMISSQKVALVPNASGQGCCAGIMPTTGTVGGTSLSFDDFQFSDLAVADVNAANLAAFDTLVLLQVDTASFTTQQEADINAFVDAGHKLIIYDSDATNGVDYSWLVYPFSTYPPCPNCGIFGGTLTIVEDNTLSSNDPTSPYYINTSEIPPNTDAIGDANVLQTNDPNWFGDMQATNGQGQTGWTHTYADSPSGKGALIYNGIDTDFIGSTYWAASGIDWLAKTWYLELKQQWDPTGLPHSKPVSNAWTIQAPFTIASNEHWNTQKTSFATALCRGWSGIAKTQQDLDSGTLGYSVFGWGGVCGFFNPFAKKSYPNQEAFIESLMGSDFTAPADGTYEISADIELHGDAVAQAGAGSLDYVESLLPGKLGIAVGLVNPANLFPRKVQAANSLVLRIDLAETLDRGGFKSVAADTVLLDHMAVSYSGVSTIHTMVDLKAGQMILIYAGLQTDIDAWGNASAVVKPWDSKLTEIRIVKK